MQLLGEKCAASRREMCHCRREILEEESNLIREKI